MAGWGSAFTGVVTIKEIEPGRVEMKGMLGTAPTLSDTKALRRLLNAAGVYEQTHERFNNGKARGITSR